MIRIRVRVTSTVSAQPSMLLFHPPLGAISSPVRVAYQSSNVCWLANIALTVGV